MVLTGEHERERGGPLTWRTFLMALALHGVAFLILWVAALIIYRPPDVIIPIDMTVVVNENLDREPDNEKPVTQPEKPKPEVKPEPKPEEEIKVADKKMDALVKEPEKKKKKEFKKGKLVKNDKKAPPKPFKKGEFKKAPLVKGGNGPRTDKKLSQAEIAKALLAGARPGTTNQLAANEEQRCVSLIGAALKRHWTEEFIYTDALTPAHLELKLGPGGRILGYRIVKSTGDKRVDATILAAAKSTGAISGLSAQFLERYSVLVVEMKPEGR